jgi:hypothetical protein
MICKQYGFDPIDVVSLSTFTPMHVAETTPAPGRTAFARRTYIISGRHDKNAGDISTRAYHSR